MSEVLFAVVVYVAGGFSGFLVAAFLAVGARADSEPVQEFTPDSGPRITRVRGHYIVTGDRE